MHKNESKVEGNRYILFFFSTLLSLFQKESNLLSDLGKETKSQSILYLYQKTTSQTSANFASEFPGRGSSKPKKKIYISHLRTGLETHLVSTTSTTSSTIN